MDEREDDQPRVCAVGPVVRTNTNFTHYIGVDCSLHGMCVAIMECVGVASIKLQIHYWSTDRLTGTSSPINGVDVEFVRHEPLPLVNPSLQEQADLVERVVGVLPTGVQSNAVSVALEEPLPSSKTTQESQRELTFMLTRAVRDKYKHVCTVDNLRVKLAWYRYDLFLTRRTGARINRGVIDHVPTKGQGRKWSKFAMYTHWINLGVLPPLVENSVPLFTGTALSAQNLSNTPAYRKIVGHPVSDIVDSVAIALYLRALDGFGPTT